MARVRERRKAEAGKKKAEFQNRGGPNPAPDSGRATRVVGRLSLEGPTREKKSPESPKP